MASLLMASATVVARAPVAEELPFSPARARRTCGQNGSLAGEQVGSVGGL